MRPTRLHMVLLLALLTRLSFLLTEPVSSDEAFTWRLTRCPLPEMCQRVAADGHPPLHFIALWAWSRVFGDTLASMRSLSVAFGLGAILVAESLVRQASIVWGKCEVPAAAEAGLLSALLLALDATQTAGAASGRMYGMGVFFASLSCLLLFRATTAERSMRRWASHGAAAAGFCYCHHYAVFSVLAQAAIILCIAGARRFRRRADARPLTTGLAVAVGVALAIYSPWLPIFVRQSRALQEDFWIPAADLDDWSDAFFQWAAGSPSPGVAFTVPLVAAGAALACLGLRRRPGATWFFLAQAATPWLCCLAAGALGGRPILQQRYLAFAQVSWFAFLGFAECAVLGRAWAAMMAIVAISTVAYGTITGAAARWRAVDLDAAVAQKISTELRAGDRVIVAGAAQVNRMRFLLDRAGAVDPDVRCPHAPLGAPGLPNHIAALRCDDVISPASDRPRSSGRVWLVSEGPDARPATLRGSKRRGRWQWRGTDGPRRELLLLEAP